MGIQWILGVSYIIQLCTVYWFSRNVVSSLKIVGSISTGNEPLLTRTLKAGIAELSKKPDQFESDSPAEGSVPT